MTRRPRYTCSFCGTSQQDTRRMIAGPQPQAAFICAACVQIATTLLAEEQQEATHGTAPAGPAAAPVAAPGPWWCPLWTCSHDRRTGWEVISPSATTSLTR